MNPTPLLLTGAPGWLGTRLARVLAEGLQDGPALVDPASTAEIRAFVLPDADASDLQSISPRVRCIPGDIRDPASLKAFVERAEGATLFHCAGVVHPTEGVKQFYDVNFRGTVNVLEAAEAAGVKRAVVVSSNSPIGVSLNPSEVFDEHAPYRPYMSYGRSKVLMEQAVAEVQARGKLETVIIRPPWFYGPDQPPRQTLFFKMIRQSKAPIVGDGTNRRSMAYVDNICQGLLLCAQKEMANGRTYWIADRRAYTMNEIIDTIERLLEHEFGLTCAHKRMRLPFVAGQVAQMADGALQKLGLYQQKIHVLSEMNKTIACSVEHAERELGYDPKVDLEEGMRRSLAWCRERNLI